MQDMFIIDAAWIEAARKFWVGRRMTELGF